MVSNCTGCKHTIEQYQEFTATTNLYDQNHMGDALLAGLVGEVGELASLFARTHRGDNREIDRTKVLYELGDILYHISELSTHFGFSIEQVAQANQTKLADRMQRHVIRGSGDTR